MENSYARHVYDIELKSLLKNYEDGISKVNLLPAGQTPGDYIKLIKFPIDEYCRLNDIKFDSEVQILITPVSDGAYKQFLGLSLIFYEQHKIRQFLNYHEKLFQEQAEPDESFLKMIEFLISELTKNSSPFDNSKRLDIIMRWAEDKGTPKQKLKRIKNEIPTHILKWNKDNASLRNLSKELFNKKYTGRKNDFSEVFNSQKKIDWKESLESWLYLMSRLTNAPYSFLTTSNGVRPYLKIGKIFFNFCNVEQESIEKINLSMLLHSITGRSKNKYIETRSGIDSILKYVFDKRENEQHLAN